MLYPLILLSQNSSTYLSVEGGGMGINGSINVGTPFITHPQYKIFLQWGVGWSPPASQSKYSINFPVQVICKIGKENFSMETGMGSTLIFESTLNKAKGEKASNELYLSPIIGIRHDLNSWFGRLYAGPMFHVTSEEVFDDLTSEYVKVGLAVGIIF